MESTKLETLIIEAADNGVVTVTMNRPEKKNAANAVMWDELAKRGVHLLWIPMFEP